jgi:hypothetical protein
LKSKGRWAKEKVKQYISSKKQGSVARALPGSTEKVLAGAAANPMSKLNDAASTSASTSATIEFEEPVAGPVNPNKTAAVVEKVSDPVNSSSR